MGERYEGRRGEQTAREGGGGGGRGGRGIVRQKGMVGRVGAEDQGVGIGRRRERVGAERRKEGRSEAYSTTALNGRGTPCFHTA